MVRGTHRTPYLSGARPAAISPVREPRSLALVLPEQPLCPAAGPGAARARQDVPYAALHDVPPRLRVPPRVLFRGLHGVELGAVVRQHGVRGPVCAAGLLKHRYRVGRRGVLEYPPPRDEPGRVVPVHCQPAPVRQLRVVRVPERAAVPALVHHVPALPLLARLPARAAPGRQHLMHGVPGRRAPCGAVRAPVVGVPVHVVGPLGTAAAALATWGAPCVPARRWGACPDAPGGTACRRFRCPWTSSICAARA